MSDKCAYPKCGKELIHTEGRRKKKYCNADCKLRHWQELNPVKKPVKFKKVPIDEYNKLVFAKPAESSYDGKLASKFILDEVGLTNFAPDNSSIEAKTEEKAKRFSGISTITNTPISEIKEKAEKLKKQVQQSMTPYQEMLKKKRGF